MCLCGENLVSIIYLGIFSASLCNLYCTGTSQKAFLEMSLAKERAGFGAGGIRL